MENQAKPFKMTYVIDMGRVKPKELPVLTNKGRALYIKKINGIDQSVEPVKVFADQPTSTMIEQYPVLSKIVYDDACTITEYIDDKGNPIVTLFPNNNQESHQENWSALLSRPAREDFILLYKKQQRVMDSARGALFSLEK